ncbi:MAG: EAL domain-containing protein [Hyphomonadaceae bacterium]
MNTSVQTALSKFLALPGIPEEHAPHIRGRQIATFKTLLPFGIAASAVNGCAVFLLVGVSGWSTGLILWSLLFAAIILGSLPQTFKAMRSANVVYPRSKKDIRRPIYSAVAMGSLWALAPVLIIPNGSAADISLVLTVSAGMMCGGAYIFSTVPRAATCFFCLIGTGTMIGVFSSSFGLVKLPFMAVILCYLMTMWKAAYWNYANLVRNWLQQIEVNARTDEAVRQSETINMLLRDFEEAASDCLWEVDRTGNLLHCSTAFAGRLNIDTDNVVGQSMRELLIQGGADAVDVQRLDIKVRSSASFSDERIKLEKNGTERWLSFTGKRSSDGYRGVVADITDAHHAEQKISYLAHFDSLTSLANRDQLNQRLDEAVETANTDGTKFAMLCLDLDRFKTINDMYGHYIGDNVLRISAERMRTCLSDQDLAGRVGGDEFMMMVQSSTTPDELDALCQRLIQEIEAPIRIGEIQVQISASIGVALYPDHAKSGIDLIKSADLALYRAKSEGRACAAIYDQKMDDEASQRRSIEVDLKTALVNGELRLVYQPLVDSQSHKAVGFEALLRWDHPTKGSISPEYFINIAEQIGMIVPIGDWVIREAIHEAACWPDAQRVSINLSPVQVKDPKLIQTVVNALASSGLDANRLEFEVTEMVLLDDSEKSMKTLEDLHKLGISISLDDFGTGYSSLTYLRTFPFDKIKIDKSFIQSIHESHESRAIVRALVGLASSLGIRSTAEGVETSAQIESVMNEGCAELQGFYFSRPQTAETLAATGLLRRTSPKRLPIAKPTQVHSSKPAPDQDIFAETDAQRKYK